ncbi:type II secretion system major pseudopilin GspG [Thalassotalea sp. 1_MG-2023]|uniref:type II secretion system major pseudopilin GspG n=1 Tax=Thalassotalea sp. 1_MG-2023 TaxID=3062680 RepID=UPI0026E24534|nr:type II secretion system major pseudopilin GspG [Thalassotalea sp. 1_MG-2023]MDO6426493.1 type II secretion system major pseudopilin GspG [Thalassotalea sp. 1_MG-2023]
MYRNRGFTLIELLIVIVILGLLMSLVAPKMFSKVGSSKQKTALAQMQMLQTSLDTYRLDIGDYPTTLSELRSSEKPNWDGPYIPKAVPNDPWGNAYHYKSPGPNGEEYLLMSYGKDGELGGKDEDEDLVHQ